MSKLSLEAFSQRADQVATEDLLSSINGGTENDCHCPLIDDQQGSPRPPLTPAGEAIMRWIYGC
jgi:hypothetical protein